MTRKKEPLVETTDSVFDPAAWAAQAPMNPAKLDDWIKANAPPDPQTHMCNVHLVHGQRCIRTRYVATEPDKYVVAPWRFYDEFRNAAAGVSEWVVLPPVVTPRYVDSYGREGPPREPQMVFGVGGPYPLHYPVYNVEVAMDQAFMLNQARQQRRAAELKALNENG